MRETVDKLLAQTKGILAADESTATITKRFAAIGLVSTPELNREYRWMIFTAPGIENFLSGVILFDESVRQGLHKILEEKGIISGIKVDGGLESFNGTEQKVTKGLEGLSDRLKEYSTLGLKFTKWRAVFLISDIFPTDAFLEENLNRMADYAKISEEASFVPIVEPEILLSGNHTTTRCEEIETKVIKKLFEKLRKKGVNLENLILKTSMVLPGEGSGIKPEPFEVARVTLRALKNSVPPEVPGVVFLSGGQTPNEATANLNEINRLKADAPWQLSFSFGRALQEEAMTVWKGDNQKISEAQKVFLFRAEKVSKARQGLL